MIVFAIADKKDKSVTIYTSHCLVPELAYPVMTLSGRGLEYFIQELIGACKYLNAPTSVEEFVNTIIDLDNIGVKRFPNANEAIDYLHGESEK